MPSVTGCDGRVAAAHETHSRHVELLLPVLLLVGVVEEGGWEAGGCVVGGPVVRGSAESFAAAASSFVSLQDFN